LKLSGTYTNKNLETFLSNTSHAVVEVTNKNLETFLSNTSHAVVEVMQKIVVAIYNQHQYALFRK
jgi:hypothetical protein